MVTMCKCPFCFKKFNPNMAFFKTETVYTNQDLEAFTPDEAIQKEIYLRKPDEIYNKFWEQYPGSDHYSEYEENAVMATIGDYDSGIITGIPRPDETGFVSSMEDSEGKISKVRICPLCHNILPHEFGKYPVIYIAVVGITASGKTVYLSQLMKSIQIVLAKGNLVQLGMTEEAKNFVESHFISRGSSLPGATASDSLSVPIPITVQQKDTGNRFTLMFYDIAGECCVNPAKMDVFGPFIANANGIVMIIDPKQFPEIFGDPYGYVDVTYSPSAVADAMYTAFGSGANGGSEIPLAVAISKSDLMRDSDSASVNTNSIIFRNTRYEDYGGKYGMPYDDINTINTEIKMIIGREKLSQGGLLIEKLKSTFTNNAFFAFSALNSAPKRDHDREVDVMKEDPEPLRIEDPLLWLLNNIGIVPKISKLQTNGNPQRRGFSLFGGGKR